MPSVVITGSTKGVGFGLAKAFRARGYAVLVSGRDEQTVADAVRRLEETPGPAAVVGRAADVSDRAQVQALWDAAATAFDRVDVWVNNAGLARTTRSIVDTDPGDVRAMVTTNVLGTIYGSQVAVAGMSAQGGGKVFNVLGGGSDGRARPGMGVYASTKRGLKMFTDALVKETKDGPVLVGEIRPGILVSEGMLREAAEMDPTELQRYVRTMDVLSDRVDDVAPWLVDQVIATDRHGTQIAWLGSAKIARRFATARWSGRSAFSSAYDGLGASSRVPASDG